MFQKFDESLMEARLVKCFVVGRSGKEGRFRDVLERRAGGVGHPNAISLTQERSLLWLLMCCWGG